MTMDPTQLLPYQRRTIKHILQHPNCMLWQDMGMGKTVSTLTAIKELTDRFEVPGALVVAPKRVMESVWRQEAAKWSHLKELTFSKVHGTEGQRVAAIRRHAHVYLTNYRNLAWLATFIRHYWLTRGKFLPFQMVVYDEVTKVKNPQSKRMKAWGPILPHFKRRLGLTGEPASNGYKDLFGQYLAVDAGQRLGTTITSYRDRFLRPFGHMGTQWAVTKTGQQMIHDRIADITLEMSADDYLDLPPVRETVLWVDLPPRAREIYDELERQFFVELDTGREIEVLNEASKLNKLIQIASGAAYLSGTDWEEIHREKIEALSDAVEEAGGRPMLLGYGYIHEAQRIAAAFPEKPQDKTGASFLSSKLGERAMAEVIRRWEFDEIPLLCGHPASMGHGLNLQHSSARSVIWFSLPWSLELYRQMNARILGGHRRQGESSIIHILSRNTMDEVVYDVLANKASTQEGLKRAIRTYRDRR